MSRLLFHIDPSDDLRGAAAASVEIRQTDDHLVRRTTASQTVEELDPGRYLVSVRFPDGREVVQLVELEEDDQKRVDLTPPSRPGRRGARRPPEEPRREQRAHEEETTLAGDALAEETLEDLELEGVGETEEEGEPPVEFLDVELPGLDVIGFGLPRPGGGWGGAGAEPMGGAGRDVRGGQVESFGYAAEQPTPLGFRIALGDLLGGEVRYEPPEHIADEDDVLVVQHPGREGSAFLQLLQPGQPPLNLGLPSAPDSDPAEVWVVPATGGGFRAEVHLGHPEADLLLRYAHGDLWSEAETAVDDGSLSAESLLRAKLQEPVAAAAGAYVLLRLGELERLHDWTQNLMRWVRWLPDGGVLRGEHLARLGRHEEALDAFVNGLGRGLPLFTWGMSYAISRLRLYTRLGVGTDEAAARARTILEGLLRFEPYLQVDRLTLSFTGLDPTQPDARELPDEPFDALEGIRLPKLAD